MAKGMSSFYEKQFESSIQNSILLRMFETLRRLELISSAFVMLQNPITGMTYLL